jgi:aryl-alcohol dehydrogenase-like predicted oxidoreductase
MPPKDIRLGMPRFQAAHFPKNLLLLDGLSALAAEQGCTMGQLALAWVLAQGPHIVPIPGTTRLDHLEENVGATDVTLSREMQDRLNALINPATVSGTRYAPAVQIEIDTEELGTRV